MARESITDLIYQYLRSLVHAGFRDGAISGLREAFSLPEERDEPPALTGGPVPVSCAHPGSWGTTSPQQRTTAGRPPLPGRRSEAGAGDGPERTRRRTRAGSSPVQEPGGTA